MTRENQNPSDGTPGGSGAAAFIQRIQSALGVVDTVRPDRSAVLTALKNDASRQLLAEIHGRNRTERQALVDCLREMAVPLNLGVRQVADRDAAGQAVAEIIRQRDPEWGGEKAVAVWRHPLVQALNLPERLADDAIPVHEIVAPADGDPAGIHEMRRRVQEAFVGVTAGEYCVAESATLVLKTRPGQDRSVSLVPSIHIAVIGRERILASFTELYTLLCHDPEISKEGIGTCMTFISGPSKTADIEAHMVHGAHGPREMWLVVINGSAK